ncbi:MAG: 8-oxo-dGTP diphosphatase MutT [Gammaproteobacteria bacterium]|nr:8-oxo-dGTP diphosphatase MutT [Gammaproteobacteria bacterium]
MAQNEADLPRAADGVLHVLVGLIEDEQGRILVNRRRAGTHMAGHWEFPGGKLDEGESPREALDRELAEELGIVVLEAEPFMLHRHDYPERRVLLDIWHVARFYGEPRPLEGQPLAWVSPVELMDFGLLPADRPIVDALLRR